MFLCLKAEEDVTRARSDATYAELHPRQESEGDETFEKLELKRRLTIIAPAGNVPLDGDDDPDLAYDDELVYDDEEAEYEGEYYGRYSDEEELEYSEPEPEAVSNVDEDFAHTPKTLDELNILYKPHYEEKLTTIQPQANVVSQKPHPVTTTAEPTVISPAPAVNVTQAPLEVATASYPARVPPRSPQLDRTAIEPPPTILSTEPPTTNEGDEEPCDDDIEYDDEYSDELEEDDEEDISDVDDRDLMRRLEAKYGKLPDGELAGDEGGESGDGFEDDEEDPGWTSKELH